MNTNSQADRAFQSGMLIKPGIKSDYATAGGVCASETRIIKALMANQDGGIKPMTRSQSLTVQDEAETA